MSTLDRVAAVGQYKPSVTYPNTGLGLALKTVAGAMVKGTGTKVFFVQTGGFDTHAGQDTIAANGTYVKLMVSLNDGLSAFYNDLRNTGLINDTLVLSFSEFGRRITENGSNGTDHGAASVMLAMGGGVRGGLYGTAPSLNPDPNNPTLENAGADVHYETDFRSVYARVIDNWLGGNSAAVLGGDFRGNGIGLSKGALAAVLAIAISAFACGGSDNGGSTPTTPADWPTFTITSAGVSPKTLTVSVGSQVTFVNNDAREHLMYSDPHPDHTDCPSTLSGSSHPGRPSRPGTSTPSGRAGFMTTNSR